MTSLPSTGIGAAWLDDVGDGLEFETPTADCGQERKLALRFTTRRKYVSHCVALHPEPLCLTDNVVVKTAATETKT